MPSEPLIFTPLPMERVWGGRHLESLLGKNLPKDSTIGELWEIVDRPEAQSLVTGGPFQGKTLHDLWTQSREEVFGMAHGGHPSLRFPLLLKLLDAREPLSLQVHPPEHIATPPLTEPKTECWFFLDAEPDAEVYAGLRSGVSREEFAEALSSGQVAETLHRIPVHAGESLFLPSGRLHAIGAGLVIVEVQQNSDTTFRVFDWNRTGLDGQPRELHVEESLESIDFTDITPRITPASEPVISDCPYFRVEKKTFDSPWIASNEGDFSILTCVQGSFRHGSVEIPRGGFCLIPSSTSEILLEPVGGSVTLLRTTLPIGQAGGKS